mgnify:CR=1 FL=1
MKTPTLLVSLVAAPGALAACQRASTPPTIPPGARSEPRDRSRRPASWGTMAPVYLVERHTIHAATAAIAIVADAIATRSSTCGHPHR